MIRLWYKQPHSTEINYLQGTASSTPAENAFALCSFTGKHRLYLNLDELQSISLDLFLKNTEHIDFKLSEAPSLNLPDYQKLVADGVREIRSGRFRKIVLARQKKVPCSQNPLQVFKTLCQLNSNCMVHLWYKEGEYCMIGASPELLLSASAERIKSVSMAGTIHSLHPEFSAKERDEQQIVTDYIQEQMARFDLKPSIHHRQIENGPLTHLYSEMVASNPGLGREALDSLTEELHPTPAVCGFPYVGSSDYIRSKEGFDRGFYSG